MKYTEFVSEIGILFSESELSQDIWFEKESLFRKYWNKGLSVEDAFVEIFDEYL